MDGKAQEFGGEQRAAAHQLGQWYADAWQQARAGSSEPPFGSDKMSELLQRAAEIVVRIRERVGKPLSSIPAVKEYGTSAQFLTTWKEQPEVASEHKFVRELVHATLRTSRFYVGGLDAEQLDELLAQFYTEVSDVADSATAREKIVEQPGVEKQAPLIG